jgi:hypothetical protein
MLQNFRAFGWLVLLQETLTSLVHAVLGVHNRAAPERNQVVGEREELFASDERNRLHRQKHMMLKTSQPSIVNVVMEVV